MTTPQITGATTVSAQDYLNLKAARAALVAADIAQATALAAVNTAIQQEFAFIGNNALPHGDLLAALTAYLTAQTAFTAAQTNVATLTTTLNTDGGTLSSLLATAIGGGVTGAQVGAILALAFKSE